MAKVDTLFNLSPQLLRSIEKRAFLDILDTLPGRKATRNSPYDEILKAARSKRESADPLSMATEAVTTGRMGERKLSSAQRRNIADSIVLAKAAKEAAGNLDSMDTTSRPGQKYYSNFRRTDDAYIPRRLAYDREAKYRLKYDPLINPSVNVNLPISERQLKDAAALKVISKIRDEKENAYFSSNAGRRNPFILGVNTNRDITIPKAKKELGLDKTDYIDIRKIKSALIAVGPDASEGLRATIISLGQGWTGTADELLAAAISLS